MSGKSPARDSVGLIAQSKSKTLKAESKLKRIVRTAAEIFNERGYECTSLDEIAERLNMHKATLYHYVDSKEEILYRCLAMTFEGLSRALEVIKYGNEPPLKKLEMFFSALIQAQTTEMGKCLCLVGTRPLGMESGRKIKARQIELDLAVRDIFRQGHADGSIRPCDPMLAAEMLFGAFNTVPHWYKRDGKYSPEQIAKEFLDMFINGLATRRAARKTGN